MPTTKRAGLPSFWTTAIAKALSGDQPCLLAPWMSGHFELQKRPRDNAADLATWKTNHTAQLNTEADRLKAEGWKCQIERYFKVTGSTAIVSGKADIVAQKPDCRPLIVDTKSGQPRDTDIVQVAMEIVLIPLAWNAPMIFEGLVVYPTHSVKVTQQHALDLKPKLFAMLKYLGMTNRPDARPGVSQCKFCDVRKEDCPDRHDDSASDGVNETDLF